MAKVQGFLSAANGNIESFEDFKNMDKSKNDKIRNGLKTSGKIIYKLVKATGKFVFNISGVHEAFKIASDVVELVGDVKNVVVESIAANGNTFNTGMQKSNEAVMGA